MLVLSWDQGFDGVLHQLINVEVNHDSGMTLYAPSQDEEARVHKKQGHNMTCDGKCWQT
jgi:hypothetical protein